MTSTLIKTTLDKYADKEKKIFKEDRKQTLGASEVGQCARKMWYLKNEDDPKANVRRDEGHIDSWGARVRGTIYEDHWWVKAMRNRFKTRLLYAGRNQHTFTKGFLSATPDGLLIDLLASHQEQLGTKAYCITVEAKTFDPRTNLEEPKPEHVYQCQVQLGLVRELTQFKPTHALLSYTDASFWSDVREFVIPFDEQIYQSAIDRSRLIMTASAASELKPEGWIAGGRECKYCPFTTICGIQRRNVPFTEENEAPVDPQFAAEIREMALYIKFLEAERNGSDELLRGWQYKIKERLREKGIRKVPGVVTWSEVKGREGYDNKAIQAAAMAAGIDIKQFATVGEPTDRLTISVKSPSEANADEANQKREKAQ